MLHSRRACSSRWFCSTTCCAGPLARSATSIGASLRSMPAGSAAALLGVLSPFVPAAGRAMRAALHAHGWGSAFFGRGLCGITVECSNSFW